MAWSGERIARVCPDRFAKECVGFIWNFENSGSGTQEVHLACDFQSAVVITTETKLKYWFYISQLHKIKHKILLELEKSFVRENENGNEMQFRVEKTKVGTRGDWGSNLSIMKQWKANPPYLKGRWNLRALLDMLDSLYILVDNIHK